MEEAITVVTNWCFHTTPLSPVLQDIITSEIVTTSSKDPLKSKSDLACVVAITHQLPCLL
jgi:hypothetical protein